MKFFSIRLIPCLALLGTFALFPGRSPAASPETANAPAGKNLEPGLDGARRLLDQGKYQDAITYLERVLEQNPGHSPAKALLLEALVSASVESYLLGAEDQSYQYLSRAMELEPDMERVNRLYEKVKGSRFGVAQKERPSPQPALPADAQAFREMMGQVVEKQNQMIAATQGSFQEALKSSREEKKEILQSLQQRENLLVGEVKKGWKGILWISLAALGLLLLVVGTVLFVLNRIAVRRERLLMEQGEQFARMIQEQSGKVLENMANTLKSLPNMAQSNQLTFSGDSAAKFQKMDVIDAEIMGENLEAVGRESQMLDAFLNDSNPEVQARAIQILLKYDLDQALERIQAMLSGGAAAARLAAVRLLGGISNHRSVDVLVRLLKDPDLAVKKEAMIALRTLANEDLEAHVKEQIQMALSYASEKEGWIVK